MYSINDLREFYSYLIFTTRMNRRTRKNITMNSFQANFAQLEELSRFVGTPKTRQSRVKRVSVKVSEWIIWKSGSYYHFLRSFTYTIHKTPTTLLQCDEENKLISYFKTSISLILFWYFNSKLELRDLVAFFLSFPITDVIGIL